MVPNAVEAGEVAYPFGDGVVGRGGRTGALGDDEEIFGGMLGGDKFENLGFVAGPFEEQGAESIGHEFGLTFLKDSVAKSVGEHGGEQAVGDEFPFGSREKRSASGHRR